MNLTRDTHSAVKKSDSINDDMADKNIEEIYQFLVDNNFESTAEALIREASKMGCKLREVTDSNVELMLHYNTGNYLMFFQLWSELFSDNTKQCEEYKKLTFYLHVHFAVLPKRKFRGDQCKETNENNVTEIEKNINDSMKQLQDYLSGDGKELEHVSELQTFYALPFIEDIYASTCFSKVLEQDWLDDLSKNLELFIIRHRQDFTNSDKINCNEAQLQNLVEVHTTMQGTQAIAMKSTVTQNKTKKNDMLIVPNDRDIPIFVEDEEQDIFFNEKNFKSKGTQTYIIGNQIIINNSQEDVLNPGKSINHLLKVHKSNKRSIQHNRELALTKSHLYSIHTNYEKLKVRFHKLHADYNKLIDVAGELTAALENSVKGHNIDVQQTLETCIKIFPDLFHQKIKETSYPSLLELDRIDIKAITLPKLDAALVPIAPKLLDYKKIKLHLINGDVKTKLLLLQALRWKITLVHSMEQDEVLHEYINRDLLGLHGQIVTENGKTILPCLLTAGEAYARHLLQQFTARLLNTLASFKSGRDYLSVGSTVVNVTFACLDNNYADGVDPFACDMMVAMLQKLSLRRQQRIYMIESGLLEWLISHLHDKCRIISLYRLEYAIALLMNLSLHRLAQARASKISSLLVSTLLVLLSIDHTSSLPYINGALTNFLNNPIINEEARKIKRSNISEYLGNNQKSMEIRKHLDHVLKIQKHENVNTPQNEETGDDDDDDDNEDLNVLESELDENDPLQNYIGELNGETLLAMCYSVSSKIPQEAVNTDTTLQQISSCNSIDFYDATQYNNHVCNKHPSYSALRLEHRINTRKLYREKFQKTKMESLSLEMVKSFEHNFSKEERKPNTIYLYENQTSKNSSETTVASSTILIPGRENDQAEMEKLNSIAPLNSNNYTNKIIDTSWKNNPEFAKEEEAFLAKPKLSRTPP